MAKGKNAAALFEVIHSDKRFRNSASPGDALRTPKWWFKGRSKPAGEPPIESMGAPAAASPPPIDVPHVTHASHTAPAASSGPPIALALEPERSEIRFRLSYTTAIVGGFASFVVIVLAFVVGRHVSAPPEPVASPSTSALLAGPANPAVLEVERGARASSQPPRVTPVSSPAPRTSTSQQQLQASAPQAALNVQAPAAPAHSGPIDRKTGLQYVVVQSYPPEEEQMARSAADVLRQNGIDVTLIKGLRGWSSASWFTVVGTTGFERTKNNPEYTAYIDRIEKVSAAFAGKSGFKRFSPAPYTWRDQR